MKLFITSWIMKPAMMTPVIENFQMNCFLFIWDFSQVATRMLHLFEHTHNSLPSFDSGPLNFLIQFAF